MKDWSNSCSAPMTETTATKKCPGLSRERDLPERPPRPRSVDRGGLVDLSRDRLERGEIEQHHRSGRRPGVQPDDRRQRGIRSPEPRIVVFIAEHSEKRVQQSVRRQDVGRDRHDRGGGRKRWEVERRTEERPKPDRLIHHNGEGKAERHLERDDNRRVDERVAHRVLPEDAVVVELAVVVEADERSPEDAPVVAADVRGVADREDEERRKNDIGSAMKP